ncbi:AsnC family transcriptional regulator [Methylobacterium nigriterrae]|uniref:AsnC family transcriptional regulator n=1 Tax=Methylobacterium nigriterrae TaxID=3127512 RepID=UPI0030132D49
MLFEYTRRRGARSPVTDAATFKVDRLNQAATRGKPTVDLSHLIDLSYNYHSPRELRWHLADRLGIKPGAVDLREAGRA